MTLQPHLYRSLPFDPVRDFEPAAPIYHTHFFVVVSADSRGRTSATWSRRRARSPTG